MMHCRGLGELWSNWGQRFQLVVFLLLGTTFAFLHHVLGTYLSSRPVPRGISICGVQISNQAYVSALSNALSQVVKFLFASTIGLAFTQYFFFWSQRRGYVKVGQDTDPRLLDAPLAAANGNPFTISALPTWCRSPALAITSLAMVSMIAIPIFAPGSIVPVQGNLWQPCTIRSPNVTKAYLTRVSVSNERRALSQTSSNSVYDDWMNAGYTGAAAVSASHQYSSPSLTRNLNPIFETTAIVNNIITAGSYLPVSSPCGVCAYQVNFTAADLDCSSAVNSTYNFLTNLPFNGSNDTLIPLFHGNVTQDNVLTLGIRDGVVPHMNPPMALSCNAFQARYVVQVQHTNCASRIDILNITRGPRLSGNSDPSVDQLNGLVRAVGGALTGRIVLQKDSDNLNEGATLAIAYSPQLRWTSTNGTSAFVWSNLTSTLPSLMQNISLSLLSGRFPASEQPYMDEVKTQCLVEQLVYNYHHNRLLIIYAVTWAATAAFFSFGFYIIYRKNQGEEHTLDFSHVIEELVAPPSEMAQRG